MIYEGLCIGGSWDGRRVRHDRNVMPVPQEGGLDNPQKREYYIFFLSVWWPYKLGTGAPDPQTIFNFLVDQYEQKVKATAAQTDTVTDG